ncbi:MAG: hypothetical protein CVU78_08200 [Elusimicrobia bacterium HGW-Elusimicrobia-2]|nr:MAG: hypothetical protein CVU78_08200 [Elusimicrobia bacterium HGW-Elusimicrobia-2]
MIPDSHKNGEDIRRRTLRYELRCLYRFGNVVKPSLIWPAPDTVRRSCAYAIH